MEFKLTRNSVIAELVVISDNAKITEDVARHVGNGAYKIPESDIHNMAGTVFEMHRYNGLSDPEILKYYFDNLLTKGEKEDFLSMIAEQEAENLLP